ncbi:MAG: aminopeptidase [FCB group bacterium]|nr:aminopeptidase [FCB group bacterium]
MKDPRIQKFARVLVNNSMKVKPGDKVLIEFYDVPIELPLVVVEEVFAAGGIPLLEMKDMKIQRKLYLQGPEEFFKLAGEFELYRMKQMDCYAGLRGCGNDNELADVPGSQMGLMEKHWWKPVHLEERCSNTRWVVCRFPSPAYAQKAGMSQEAFEDFFFNACNEVDYGRLSEAMQPLEDLMNRTDKVRIVSPGTDLTFSIKGIPAQKCDGKSNIPDGEVYTAPVIDSANGTISYNAPSTYRGFTFTDIKLIQNDGVIIEASANDTERLNDILDSDEGARRIGEFALGVNPMINRPMDDILFDEKIAGSIHFTPGDIVEELGGNGNHSGIHWDIVLIQTPEYGGGEIYFDDVLIRKDGKFVLYELLVLNPDRLLI